MASCWYTFYLDFACYKFCYFEFKSKSLENLFYSTVQTQKQRFKMEIQNVFSNVFYFGDFSFFSLLKTL